jgi:hypothetical protein
MGFSAVPMQAQWAVFDVSTWTAIGQVWNEDISTNLKLAQTLTQGAQIIQNGLQIYNLAMRETTALRNKQWMLAAGSLANLPSIPGHPNWTVALKSSAGPIVAAGVWQEMVKPGGSLANRVQIADAFGGSMVGSLGSCNAAAVQTDGAIGQFENFATSFATLDNTHAALGGATNMGLTQLLRVQECQHNLQQQQAQAQLVHLMQQRDYEYSQLTTQQDVVSIGQSNPRGMTNLAALNAASFN